jgi:hypothetical protein
VQRVEVLPLVLVDALHVHVEERVRVDGDAVQLLQVLRQRHLVGVLRALPLFAKAAVFHVSLEAR